MTVASGRRVGVVALTVAGALVLAACSGPDSGSTPAANGTDAVISITVQRAPLHFEPLYIAQRQGFFTEVGLDVTIDPAVPDPASGLAQLVTGEIDIATQSWTALNTATAAGLPIQLIAANGQESGRDEFGLMVGADSGINSVADLKGKKMAVPAVKGGIDLPVLLAAEAEGIDPDSITQIAMPFPAMQAALESGAVDAVPVGNPFYQQMVAAGFKSLGNLQKEYTPRAPVTAWCASKDWLTNNGEAAERFVAAMELADKFYNDPANVEVVKGITAEINGIPVEAVAPPVFVSVMIDEKGATQHRDNMARLGFIDGDPVPFADLIWSGTPRA